MVGISTLLYYTKSYLIWLLTFFKLIILTILAQDVKKNDIYKVCIITKGTVGRLYNERKTNKGRDVFEDRILTESHG